MRTTTKAFSFLFTRVFLLSVATAAADVVVVDILVALIIVVYSLCDIHMYAQTFAQVYIRVIHHGSNSSLAPTPLFNVPYTIKLLI